MKELREKLIAWAKNHLDKDPFWVAWETQDGVRNAQVRFTHSCIEKSLKNIFNQATHHLTLVYQWRAMVLNARYIQPEERQHAKQTSTKCFHRLRWRHPETGQSYDIVVRELIGQAILQVYFIHPTKK